MKTENVTCAECMAYGGVIRCIFCKHILPWCWNCATQKEDPRCPFCRKE